MVDDAAQRSARPDVWTLDAAERAAQDAVGELVRAAEEAGRLVEEARLRAAAIDADAEERLHRANTEIEARLAAAAAEAEAYVERARREAAAILGSARRDAASRSAPAGAPPAGLAPVGEPVGLAPEGERAGPAPEGEPADPAPEGEPAGPYLDVGAGIIRSVADESALERRDAELDGLLVGLGRRLKRVLQDDHNDLLDGLRRVPGAPTAAAVLASPDAQIERFAAAARPFVERAAEAGVWFVTPVAGCPAPAVGEVDAVVAGVAGPAVRGFAAAIAGPLRQRVEAVLDERGQDAPARLVEALASVYREARSQRIEALAADVLSAAHSEAVWRAAPEGVALRWIAEDAGGPCPDCDDNVLAGPVPKGETFPTGQLHPPAHRGCRCLLVPEG